MITRTVQTSIDVYLNGHDPKIYFLWGPRRSGKTTLLRKVASEKKVPIFNFDLLSDQAFFTPNKSTLEKIAREHAVILIDEVQSYPESTVALKVLHDTFGIKVIATGSSELRQKSQQFDSLAGRFNEHYCLPLSYQEIQADSQVYSYETPSFAQTLLQDAVVFGLYPETYTQYNLPDTDRIGLLENILDTYVLKDVIDIYNLKNTKLAKDILTKVALQVGSEVSVREIANSLQANASTVASYIEIFIKNYILIPLHPFKTNLRRAVSENRKLYFYDLGLRNALVHDFRPLALRPDAGGVFENFIIAEVEKQRRNQNIHANLYFYREYGGKENDLIIEDYHKQYHCVEIKSQAAKHGSDIFPLPHDFSVIHPANYAETLPNIFKRSSVQ